jgi:hypothetical protein
VYDARKEVGSRSFTLRAMLVWTIYDFLGYGTVGGFSHQGYVDCPYCGLELGAIHSMGLGKQLYAGTRRWLDHSHPYHSRRMEVHFDGKPEVHEKPRLVIVDEQIQRAKEYEVWKAMGNRPGSSGDPSKVYDCKRLSILY